MSKGIFFRLVITLVVACFVGTQVLYAQNVTRYETKGKGAWEDAGTWEIVTRDSLGNVVVSIDAIMPPQSSIDVVVNHSININDEPKQIGSLTVTGSGLIAGESAATDITIEAENDIAIENGGRISTTNASKEWFASTGTINLSSSNGNVTVNGIIETGNGLNSTDILNRGGLSGDIYILASPDGIIVIGSGARLVTGYGGNGAEADVDGIDATNGGTSGDITLVGNSIEQLGSVITGAGGNGGDAGGNGGNGGDGGDSGQIAIVGTDIRLSGFVQSGNGGNGGNSKADNRNAGDGGDSESIAVSGPFVFDAVIVIDNCDITQGQGGYGGSAKGANASAGTDGRRSDVGDASDEPCPKISGGIIYVTLDNPKVDLDGALCSLESQSDIIFYGLHEDAISGEFGVVVSAPGVIDLTNVVAGKNMITSTAGEIIFRVSDADNILLAPGMSLEEITEPDATIREILPTAYIVVDDFESYTDFPPNEVWMRWIDGWGVPTNGSTAGYPEPDFIEEEYHIMETEIVHTGEQAFPLFYDNSVGLSEVTRTLNANWAQYGVDRLTLWYHGNKDNAAEPMYIALNGNAIVINDDPNAALVDEWTQWDILLQSFTNLGVSLGNVDTMSIGFGNKANPTPGGEGHVLFDDIRLYMPMPD